MKSLTMMIENVQLDVYYEAEICRNSNGVGGGATCEPSVINVEVRGVDIGALLDENIVERIIDNVVKEELENLK